jgi:DNA-binding HxlR family transcriptional regulator
MVRRDVQQGPGVRVVYELTSKGNSLKPVLGSLKDWARRWHQA